MIIIHVLALFRNEEVDTVNSLYVHSQSENVYLRIMIVH